MKRHSKRRTRKGLLTREQAWLIVRPYAEQLYDWVIQSWDWVQLFLDQDPERRATLDEITIFSMVYDRFVFLMKSGLSADGKVKFSATGRMTRATLANEITLRFKKLDAQLRSRNIGTLNQDTIYNQESELAGMIGHLTNITVGYLTDRSNTKLKSIYLTCPSGYTRNAWTIPLSRPDEAGGLRFNPNGIDGAPDAPLIAAKYGEKVAGNEA